MAKLTKSGKMPKFEMITKKPPVMGKSKKTVSKSPKMGRMTNVVDQYME